jgi:hypothetical protein
MPYKSNFFKRNAGGNLRVPRRSYGAAAWKGRYSGYKRASVINRRAAPHPPPSRIPINADTVKQVTYLPAIYLATESTTQPAVLMDVVAVGTADNTRIGAKWQDLALHVKGRIIARSSECMAGYALVWDKSPQSAIPNFNDVFQGIPGFHFYAPSSSSRFEVLFQKEYALTNQVGAGNPLFVNIDEYFKVGANKIAHTQSTDLLGNAVGRRAGALWMFFFSNKPTGTTSPIVDVARRLYFQEA